ncbi:MAG TPA: SRPBCC family protein [Terriglobales bacterium]|nr:SRPBCC family protein [Terriglobales bacterium]
MAANPKINSMQSSEWDLVITRVFDAPRELVWKAWTDPKHLAQWWGPKGFTNPRCEWNAHPNGTIRIDMRAPDGVVYPMSGVFQEIVEPERLVFVSSALDENGNSMFDVLATATFTERRGKTSLTLQLRVLTTTARAPQHLKGMEAGWAQSLDRLADRLAEAVAASEIAMVSGDREIVGTHLFDAPRDLVWKMWTDRYHVAQWWGPKGFRTTIHEMDARPGGEWRFIMHGPDGRDYHNRVIFREVQKPERLVYEHSPDKDSEPVRFVTTVTLIEEGEQTRVRVHMLFPTAAERDHNVKTYGAVEGLRQHFGRLADYLQKASAENPGSPA